MEGLIGAGRYERTDLTGICRTEPKLMELHERHVTHLTRPQVGSWSFMLSFGAQKACS